MLRFRAIASVLAAASVPLFANAATAQTLVARWHMENPAVMTDSSGNRHSGRTTSGVSSVRGSSGRGYAFNGTNSVVVVPHSNALNPRGANFTFTVHVRFSKVPSATQKTYDLIRKGTSTTPGGYWKAEIVRADATHARVGCYFKGSAGGGKRVAGDNLADGGWHVITCRWTATEISTIIDGVSASKTVTVGTIANTEPVLLGAKFVTGGDRYRGNMDELNIAAG
jgi:Concanavalin A-like lectin/glucanases superfamily